MILILLTKTPNIKAKIHPPIYPQFQYNVAINDDPTGIFVYPFITYVAVALLKKSPTSQPMGKNDGIVRKIVFPYSNSRIDKKISVYLTI